MNFGLKVRNTVLDQNKPKMGVSNWNALQKVLLIYAGLEISNLHKNFTDICLSSS